MVFYDLATGRNLSKGTAAVSHFFDDQQTSAGLNRVNSHQRDRWRAKLSRTETLTSEI